MDEAFFNEAMDAVGLQPIYVNGRVDLDANQPSKIKKLHPTLKKCLCGQVGTKSQFLRHMEYEREQSRRRGEHCVVFWKKHGEIPLNVGDPLTEEENNARWMEGQHPNYND